MVLVKWSRSLHAIQFWLAKTDRAVVRTIDSHTNLATAVVVLSLCVWGIVTHHLSFAIAIIGVGAIAFTLGATLSLFVSVVLTILSVKTGHGFNATLTTALFEFVGYLLVARLGFKHRQEQNVLQQRGQNAMTHRDQVMPWHVSNDIRTSLAAVRFLLFPIRDEQNHHSVDEAMNELSRLEKLFEEMEKK